MNKKIPIMDLALSLAFAKRNRILYPVISTNFRSLSSLTVPPPVSPPPLSPTPVVISQQQSTSSSSSSISEMLNDSAAAMPTSWKGVKRFYAHVDVKGPVQLPLSPSALKRRRNEISQEEELNGWTVLIQGRPVRTHGMNDLIVPSKALAVAIAGEFAAQRDHVVPATMPIYNLACSAIDQFLHEDLDAAEDLEAEMRAMRLSTFDRIAAAGSNTLDGPTGAEILAAAREVDATSPSHAQSLSTGRSDAGGMGGQGSGTSKLRDLALDYLETDTACYRVDLDTADASERLLRKRQDKHYNPLIKWYEERLGAKLSIAVGFADAQHSDVAYEAAEDIIDTASPWLKAFYSQTLGCLKSSVLAFALANRVVDVDEAYAAARVEEEFQISSHGFVEDGHDSQRSYLRLQIASAVAYLGMLPKSSQPVLLPNPSKKDYDAQLSIFLKDRSARVGERRENEKKRVDRKRELMKRIKDEEAKS
jgi:chaperone required for assembly of F1-ATPase